MKIVFLGTNGWYDTKTGNTICTLIESNDYFIILDAGNGIYKVNEYIKDSTKPIYLFLSHFHIDHIEGLHTLNKFNFKQGIQIYGQKRTEKILKTVITKPYTVPFEDLPFNVTLHEVTDKDHKLPFLVKSKPLIHSSSCLGYRFEVDGKILAYCTDTGICDNAFKLAENADLLITECSLKERSDNNEWPHLNPEDAVEIAKISGAKKLALTHFDANIYRSIDERVKIQNKMNDKFKNLIVTQDNMKIII
jgi:ribonuclease BN (tRNA processing enzyme)